MVMSALLLSALAGAVMLRALEVRKVQDMEARARMGGAVFAQWFQAAHHLAQSEEAHYRDIVARRGGGLIAGTALRSADLVPAWLPASTDAGQAITLGVIDDGQGVPMAFALASPAQPLSLLYLGSFVAGAAENRVGDIAGPGRNTRSARWRAAIEAVLGRALQRGELYATTDAGIAHDRRVLYRRAQPGRSGHSRMETPLRFAGEAGISEIGTLVARRSEFAEGLTVGTLQSGGGLAAKRAEVKGELRARHAAGQSVAVHGVLSGSRWTTGTIEAANLGVETELAALAATALERAAAPVALAIDGTLEASIAQSPQVMSEGLAAWRAA